MMTLRIALKASPARDAEVHDFKIEALGALSSSAKQQIGTPQVAPSIMVGGHKSMHARYLMEAIDLLGAWGGEALVICSDGSSLIVTVTQEAVKLDAVATIQHLNRIGAALDAEALLGSMAGMALKAEISALEQTDPALSVALQIQTVDAALTDPGLDDEERTSLQGRAMFVLSKQIGQRHNVVVHTLMVQHAIEDHQRMTLWPSAIPPIERMGLFYSEGRLDARTSTEVDSDLCREIRAMVQSYGHTPLLLLVSKDPEDREAYIFCGDRPRERRIAFFRGITRLLQIFTEDPFRD